mgnify:CR=1 FL=1
MMRTFVSEPEVVGSGRYLPEVVLDLSELAEVHQKSLGLKTLVEPGDV